MSIEDRIKQAEQKYDELQSERDEILHKAEEILTELTKLQGEYRILKDLAAEVPKNKVKGEK